MFMIFVCLEEIFLQYYNTTFRPLSSAGFIEKGDHYRFCKQRINYRYKEKTCQSLTVSQSKFKFPQEHQIIKFILLNT